MDLTEKDIVTFILIRDLGEGSIQDIADRFGTLKDSARDLAFQVSRNTLANRFKVLLVAGYVEERKEGVSKIYQLTDLALKAIEEFEATETGKMRIQIWKVHIKKQFGTSN